MNAKSNGSLRNNSPCRRSRVGKCEAAPGKPDGTEPAKVSRVARQESNSTALSISVVDYTLGTSDTTFGERSAPTLWGYLKPVESEVTIGREQLSTRRYGVGDFRLVRAGTPIRRIPHAPTVLRSVSLPEDALTEEFIGVPTPRLGSALERLEKETFRSYMIELLLERLAQAQDSGTADLLVQSLGYSLVFELARLAAPGCATPMPGPSLSEATLAQIESYVWEEAEEKIDVGTLAALAGMSKSIFARIFREATGESPYQFVLSIRVKKARHLIMSSSLSLAEIAFQCGFSSQSHMNGVFQQKVGATPGAIRLS